jgi:hypothetical protein
MKIINQIMTIRIGTWFFSLIYCIRFTFFWTGIEYKKKEGV